jgi:tRNA pseudouridine55 synthase
VVLQKDRPFSKADIGDGFVVLIDKDRDWTSFDVVKKIRSTVKMKKVGHAGTLDPFASGLMIIGAGKATKTLTNLTALRKKYQVTIRFGVETDTYDRTGRIIKEGSTDTLDYDTIKIALDSFSETYEQIPPMYSAKKVNGKRLYKLARKGIEIERKPVLVNLYQTEMVSWDNPYLTLMLDVSKGFYIRSYAYELGRKVGTGATTEELRRIAIGDYSVSNSFNIDEFVRNWKDLH